MAEKTSDKIARLKAILETGVKSTSVDGVSTTFDLDSVRRELSRLEQFSEVKRRRSVVNTPNMGRR